MRSAARAVEARRENDAKRAADAQVQEQRAVAPAGAPQDAGISGPATDATDRGLGIDALAVAGFRHLKRLRGEGKGQEEEGGERKGGEVRSTGGLAQPGTETC